MTKQDITIKASKKTRHKKIWVHATQQGKVYFNLCII